MNIKMEILIGKVLSEYYSIPKNKRLKGDYFKIREKNKVRFAKDFHPQKEFYHEFERVKAVMKKNGDMSFVLQCLELKIEFKDIADLLSNRAVARLTPSFDGVEISQAKSEPDVLPNTPTITERVKKKVRKIKRKMKDLQIHFSFPNSNSTDVEFGY